MLISPEVSANFPSRDSDMHQLAIPIILGHRGFTQFDQPESRSIFFNLQSQLVGIPVHNLPRSLLT